MKTYLTLCLLFAWVALAGCTKDDTAELRLANELEGTWTLQTVLANDHWGAPLTWRDASTDKQVRFATDGQYYEKQAGEASFTLVGRYDILDEDEVKITELHPALPDSPAYTLYYSFEPGRLLVLRKKQFEGVVAEKFSLAE